MRYEYHWGETWHDSLLQATPFTGVEPPAEIKDSKLYTRSCHCSAVTLALKTMGPLNEEVKMIGECDSSICAHVCPTKLI
jgi:hypothetical protein